MSEAVWIAILASSGWGIINTIVAGILVRNRTKNESTRLGAEANKFQSEAEQRIYDNLQGQLSDAIDRAATAETRATEALDEAHLQGARVLKLIKMFEEHIPWDRAILELLQKLGVPASDIPKIPELNPYTVLSDGKPRRNGTALKTRPKRKSVQYDDSEDSGDPDDETL